MSLHHGFKWPEWSKYSEKSGLSAPWLTSITHTEPALSVHTIHFMSFGFKTAVNHCHMC